MVKIDQFTANVFCQIAITVCPGFRTRGVVTTAALSDRRYWSTCHSTETTISQWISTTLFTVLQVALGNYRRNTVNFDHLQICNTRMTSNDGLRTLRGIPAGLADDDLPKFGAVSGKSDMKRTYSSFLIALICLLIPGLIWVFATTQLFGLSIKLAAIHITG